jgi:hypothetical protein
MWTQSHSLLPLVDPAKLQFCIRNKLNVLLKGRHGVGKTALVRQAFEKAGLSLLVFSGPTMDPWVDFVGVPRPVKRKDGKTVLQLVRREEFEDDAVDAVFFDEFNRAPAKVRNAAMELLQFQSVNGHRFERLKTVWAAINPFDDDYDTERLDPAQLDRFHVHIEVPSRPCAHYFVGKYGAMGRGALEWWDQQSAEAQKGVSPRRLEYAIEAAIVDGPLRDILPPQANIAAFVKVMEQGPVFHELKDLLARGDKAGARALLSDPLKGSQALAHVVNSKAARLFFLPLVSAETLMSLLVNRTVLETVVEFSVNIPEFYNALVALLGTDQQNVPLKKLATSLAKKHGVSIRHDASPVLLSTAGDVTSAEIAKIDPYGRLSS